jgi:hypothetical protein
MSAEFQWPPVSTRERTDGISSDGLGLEILLIGTQRKLRWGMVT